MGLTVGTHGKHRTTPAADYKPMVGTEQQEAIWSALIHGTTHVEVQARAGTGKSTTAREGIHRLANAGGPRQSIAYAAFNRHVAAEFQAILPSGATAKTLHAFGFEILKQAIGTPLINQYKSENIAELYFPNKWHEREERRAVAALVGLCKANLIDGLDPDDLIALSAAHDIYLGKRRDEVFAVVPEVLRESKELTSTIDYDDMLWLPVVLEINTRRTFDVLFVDESQDLNRAQHRLLDILCPTGRLVSIGDPHQAIYGFRGADVDSMDTLAASMTASVRGLMRFPLTTTWRCPRSHVELAQRLVPDLKAAPNAIEGEIAILAEEDAIAALRPGDMALCRNTAPLLAACFAKIRQGHKAVVRGREIGKGLLSLLAWTKSHSIPQLIERLDDYRFQQTAALSQLRHPEAALLAMNDRVDCLLALCVECESAAEIKSKIETLFSDDDETKAIVFSTVHRAKGLERESITLLRTDLLPHPTCRTLAAQRQEQNLLYVALTRATKRLIFSGRKPSPLANTGRPATALRRSRETVELTTENMGSLD